MRDYCGYKVAWDDGSLELQTETAAVHLAESFRELGRTAAVYSRPDGDSEWVEVTA